MCLPSRTLQKQYESSVDNRQGASDGEPVINKKKTSN